MASGDAAVHPEQHMTASPATLTYALRRSGLLSHLMIGGSARSRVRFARVMSDQIGDTDVLGHR
jgi:hypothetical protein